VRHPLPIARAADGPAPTGQGASNPPSSPAAGGTAQLATARWEALGTSVVLRVTDPLWLPRASAILARELDAIDRACSRFRADSDLSRVNAHAGERAVRVAPLLIEALHVALRAAVLTDGDVDPTLGGALVLAGYDRDWALMQSANPDAPALEARPPNPGSGAQTERTHRAERIPSVAAPPAQPVVSARLRSGYRTIRLDPAARTVSVPRGIALDLGATAKAWAADRAALALHEICGCGVLVSLGGDIATAGPAPACGWQIHVTDDHRAGPHAPGQRIVIHSGGLATSSVIARRWRRDGHAMHHIIDPALHVPLRGPWRTVTVAAATCTDANIATTAALVRGKSAPAWLAQLGLPARLVAHGGEVSRVGAWPVDPVAPAPDPNPPPQHVTPLPTPPAARLRNPRGAARRGRKPRPADRRGGHPRADDPQ
jgi:thiamine biosynthesis lipoprotein ApbE